MRLNRLFSIFIFFLVIFALEIPSLLQAGIQKKEVLMIIGAGDSLGVARVFKELKKNKLSKQYSFTFITDYEVRSNKADGSKIDKADIIIADFMKREFDAFIAENNVKQNAAIYSLRCGYLAEKTKKKGLKVNIETEQYFSPSTHENIKNLLFLTIANSGCDLEYKRPFKLPEAGIFHPEAETVFSSFDTYLSWYKKRVGFNKTGFWVGVSTFSTSASSLQYPNAGKIEQFLILALEKQGINILPIFGRPPYHDSLKKFFLDDHQNPRIDALVGFSFRFLRGFPVKTRLILKTINAPIFMPLEAHSITIKQWKKSCTGISPIRTAWQVCIPEQNGAIEPTIVGGKAPARLKGMTSIIYEKRPLPDNIDFLIKRIKAFHKLRVTPNKDKKVALFYWNHPPGKQGVGASYMNCFSSIAHILKKLKAQGYIVDINDISKDKIKKRIMQSGRNIGSWAPGELQGLMASKDVVQIPVSKYKKWFKELPPSFQKAVEEQWGKVEESNIMIKSSKIIIPLVDLGNVILLPQPSRGFGEDPAKLYHDPKVFPHHQYIAFYLWLKKEFNVNAIISLGKHGTHEWLPGKQVGLSLNCPPEILIQDIPNIYPYIVDNIGEGIQAKRRGRGIIIDHLIPPLKKGGIYMEYRELTAKIDSYHTALVTNPKLADEKLKTVRTLILKLGIDKDLGLSVIDHESVEEVEHYILELQERLIPYGNHTFGISPAGESLVHLTNAVCDKSPEIDKKEVKTKIEVCGEKEIFSLIKALNGEFIAPGEGNDPVRNPDAIPTGNNFYGFNIDKVPSREAFVMGKNLAEKMIQEYKQKHNHFPDKLGIILWSTELQRNEGAGIAAIFHLMGVEPIWDRKEQVTGVKAIPGTLLNRPRIDVLIQMSGLFRDSYAKLITLMDEAVKIAGALKDVENFIAINNKKIESTLISKGYSKEKARQLSKARIFGPMPGAYSHALQELIPNSAVWETQDEIADVFIHHSSFAYGKSFWGRPLKSAYKENLKDVKITMHTRSSNLYYMLDNDDMFAFLGGLSLAVKSVAGKQPEAIVANMQDGKTVTLDSLSKSIGKAMRSRYLNPEWIKGMQKEEYSGAKEMDQFVEHLWGFQVTTPYAVDKSLWQEIHDVYVKDKYKLDMKKFFDENNPWALQSITARMLEADRKKYWDAPEKMKKSLAKTYALSMIEKGVACCEHTCNNPMLQQFVTNIISLYGLMSQQQLELFKMTLAQATSMSQKESEAKIKKMQEGLTKTIKEIKKDEEINTKTKGKAIEGFELVDEKQNETKVTSSGSSWVIILIICAVLMLLVAGWKQKITA